MTLEDMISKATMDLEDIFNFNAMTLYVEHKARNFSS
jgi:hypothetical protein